MIAQIQAFEYSYYDIIFIIFFMITNLEFTRNDLYFHPQFCYTERIGISAETFDTQTVSQGGD